MKTMDAKKLHAFGVEFLKAYGASQENAVIITDHLVDNDLKGIEAHGAMRLFEYAKFMVDGKLAEDILFAGSQVPMSDAQGNRMIGTIKEVGEETVKMDFNHPMAGKTLNFEVEVVSVRDVTPEDLQSAGGCSCGCDGGCGDHEGGCSDHKGGCGEGCCH